jgi:hypothetical protein
MAKRPLYEQTFLYPSDYHYENEMVVFADFDFGTMA